MAYHLGRSSFSPYERGRIAAIDDEWRAISDRLPAALGRVDLGGTTEHELDRTRREELDALVRELFATFDGQSRALRMKKPAIEEAARNELATVLEEFRRPAEVILAFAMSEHNDFVNIINNCLVLTSRLGKLGRTMAPGGVDSPEFREPVEKLKAEMRKLSNRRHWTDSKLSSLRE